jgi:hypothetical protein
MTDWQNFSATGLAACMLVLPFGDLAMSLQTEVLPNPGCDLRSSRRGGGNGD